MKYKIFDIDPQLKQYETDLNQRMENYKNKKKELLAPGQKLIDFAGAGASVPLSGFGCLLVKGAKKAVEENGFLGIFTGGLASGAAGITAALLFGFIASVIFKPKAKS